MAVILNIETSTRVCSVAIAVDGKVVSLRETMSQNSHSEQITLFSNEVVKESGLNWSDIEAVSVSKGPGSYTGLRIGVSAAKGFCYGLDIPLISVNTLHALAIGIDQELKRNNLSYENTIYCPMIDARRMEVYTALFSSKLEVIEPTSAKIIDKDSFSDLLESNTIIFAGDGAEKCKDILGSNKNSVFFSNLHTSANYITKISEKKFKQGKFEDVAYFEPFYLKDFVAGIPKVKGLRQ